MKKIVKPRKRVPVSAQLSVTFTCPAGHNCGQVTTTFVGAYTSGGCHGHGEGEYCYCDSPTIVLEFDCPKCAAPFNMEVQS